MLADASVSRFQELNPLGHRLLDNPWQLALFKVSAASVGTAVLLMLRRRRTAEVAAWWMCLIYTVLMLIWTSFFALAG